MSPRPHELECCHGIGHQLGIHGCDGCCGLIFGGLVQQTEERIIKLLETKHNPDYWTHSNRCPICKAIALITGEADYYEEEVAWAESLFKGESKSVTRRKQIENGEQL